MIRQRSSHRLLPRIIRFFSPQVHPTQYDHIADIGVVERKFNPFMIRPTESTADPTIFNSDCKHQRMGRTIDSKLFWFKLRFSLGEQRMHYSTWAPIVKDKEDSEKQVKQITEAWIIKCLPSKFRPFAYLARLDKPIGTWLLAWPCFWSIALASQRGSLPDLKMLALFGIGAVLLRGAGCTINDLLDRDIDGKVDRTKLRPIASGALTPFQGLCFLGCQLLLGLGVLLQLNDFSHLLGASSLLLVATYPLMKRWTFWPQAYLGLTFNWGALLGWAAVRGSLDLSIVLPLYMSGICWTMIYDTIYAHQDKDDDIKVGVKSTALLFDANTKLWLAGFSSACISGLACAAYNADLSLLFYPFLLATAAHLAWQVYTVNIYSRADCNKKFVSNKWLGAILFGGFVVGRVTG